MVTGDAENLGSGTRPFQRNAVQHREGHRYCEVHTLENEYAYFAQDLKAIHGLNAESRELANILSTEILAEINREMIRTIYKIAEQGAAVNTATAGTL